MHNTKITIAVIPLYFCLVSDIVVNLLALLSAPVTKQYFLLQVSAVFSYIWNTLQSLNLEDGTVPWLITVMAVVVF